MGGRVGGVDGGEGDGDEGRADGVAPDRVGLVVGTSAGSLDSASLLAGSRQLSLSAYTTTTQREQYKKSLEAGSLGLSLHRYCRQRVKQAGGQSECDCITYYLTRRAKDFFLEPPFDGETDKIWAIGSTEAIELLDLTLLTGDGGGRHRHAIARSGVQRG